MKTYVCKICGHISFEVIPERCPVCFAKDSAFSENQDALKSPTDPKNLTESEKKHIPLLKKSLGEKNVQVKTRVGEIPHVMEENHYITWIDFYLDRKFISRYLLQPRILNPTVEVELKASAGIFYAIENCNLHGKWMGKIEI
ncbi:MAG: desulfoferrodoxin family protein [Acidobacteriota bacterium]